MVVALLVIALAMIAGGLTAVLQGWDIVLLEHGWTLVVAGSVFTSGGAVLLGLAATVFLLGRLRRELVTIRDRWGRAEFERIAPAPIDPVAAIAAGGLAAMSPAASPAEPPSGERADGGEAAGRDFQPDLPLFLSEKDRAEAPATTSPPLLPRDEEERADAEGGDEVGGTRLRLPDDLLGPIRPKVEAHEAEFEADEPVEEEPREEGAEEAAEAEEALAMRESEPIDRAGEEPEASSPETSLEEDGGGEAASLSERVSPVVGTYTSGDNRYVMFADGSIEADTPHGIFRFGSLDELKTFIASGGERSADEA